MQQTAKQDECYGENIYVHMEPQLCNECTQIKNLHVQINNEQMGCAVIIQEAIKMPAHHGSLSTGRNLLLLTKV